MNKPPQNNIKIVSMYDTLSGKVVKEIAIKESFCYFMDFSINSVMS